MLRLLQRFDTNHFHLGAKWKHWTLFFLILSLGIFARTWEFNQLPPGLIADEASIGVEAFDLYHFGIDRNGISYPVYFVAWGSGQNALYGYLLIPFIALFGLKSVTVKLPMLISGILTLPLIYWVTYKTFNKLVALISMFFLAISPWHIMLSRFGLESNLLPFVFISAYACLLKSLENQKWFVGACVLLGVCLYSYVTAYITIPFFLVCVLAILILGNKVSRPYLAAGLASFIIISIPIGMFIFINLAGLNSIKIGLITIPHLPTQPRFESEAGGLSNQFLQTVTGNIWELIKLLFKQYDGIIYNSIEPFGYFYGITFPLAILGAVLLILARKLSDTPQTTFLLAWLAAPLIFGVFQPVNINRINLIFLPILISIAVAVNWLGNRFKPIFPILLSCFLLAFIAFTIDYHGEIYKRIADIKFHAGLLSAIQFASTTSPGPICVTDKIDMPYIYILFVEKPNPASYLNSIEYIDANSPFRQVRSLLRYTFGKQNCAGKEPRFYLLTTGEPPPPLGNRYNYKFFENFIAYYPRP